jgi:UTP-glucose-1-phosphate uridylyltransferase
MKPTLLILAAGMGSRFGGLKQMESVGPSGETIMDYSVFDAVRAGFGKVVFVIRPDFADAFRAQLGARYSSVLPVEYAFQELHKLPPGFSVPTVREKPWGTGHAILMARDVIHEPFAAINADDFYGLEAFCSMAACLSTDSDDFCMVGYRLQQTLSENGSVARGVCDVDNGFLAGVTELTKIVRNPNGGAMNQGGETDRYLNGKEIVSMNFWGFRPHIFPSLEAEFRKFLEKQGHEAKTEFYIPSVVDSLIHSGACRVKVLETEASWFGVTYREDKPNVQRSIHGLVNSGAYPSNLWSCHDVPA